MSDDKTAIPFGPIQMLVLAFDSASLRGDILPELKRLSDAGIVRLVDLLVVSKSDAGELDHVQISDLTNDEAEEFGAIVGALVGVGAGGEEGAERGAVAGAADLADGHVFDDEEAWFVGDSIPNGTTAAIALIEHRWAIPLRDKIMAADGVALADAWIHPADLIAVGLVAAEQAASTGAP
jgi:uncharacterized membrane protein